MKYEEAESKLKALGFNVTKREQSSDEDSGTVIDQNLASGYKVDPSEKNRNITLTVSTGYSQTVPSVIGLSPDSAKTNLTNLGFVVSMVGEQFPEDGSGDERYIGAVYNKVLMQEQQLQKNKRKLQFTIMKTDEKGRIIKALAGFYYIDDGKTIHQCRSSWKI